HERPEAPRHAADQARIQTAGRHRARHRPPQGTPPHGPKSPCPCQRRCHQRRARCRRLQLSPPARMVEAFVAQNPDWAQPTRPAQIRLKSGSSRPTAPSVASDLNGAPALIGEIEIDSAAMLREANMDSPLGAVKLSLRLKQIER